MPSTRTRAHGRLTTTTSPAALLCLAALLGASQPACTNDPSATQTPPTTRAPYASCVAGDRCDDDTICQADSQRCTRACTRNEDCPRDESGRVGVCATIQGRRECAPSCSQDTPCGAGMTCITPRFAAGGYCAPSSSTCGGLGQACCANHRCTAEGLLCHPEARYLGSHPEEVCTTPCAVDADCAEWAGPQGGRCTGNGQVSYCLSRCDAEGACGNGLTCARFNGSDTDRACLRSSCGGEWDSCCDGSRCEGGRSCVEGVCRTVVTGAYAACATPTERCSVGNQSCEDIVAIGGTGEHGLACTQSCDPQGSSTCPSDGSNRTVCLTDEGMHWGRCVRLCTASSECTGPGAECLRLPSGPFAGSGVCARRAA